MPACLPPLSTKKNVLLYGTSSRICRRLRMPSRSPSHCSVVGSKLLAAGSAGASCASAVGATNNAASHSKQTRNNLLHDNDGRALRTMTPDPYDFESTRIELCSVRLNLALNRLPNPAARLFAGDRQRERGVGQRCVQREQMQPVATEQRDSCLGIQQAADRRLAHVEPAGIGAECRQQHPMTPDREAAPAERAAAG